MNPRELIKEIIPPGIVKLYRLIKYKTVSYGYVGDYSSWGAAKAASSGYDSDIILKKVKDALLAVKSGKAVYERDSVLFNKIEYAWPLLSMLLWIAAKSGNHLNIIDFGGSLGSTYFQNRVFLNHIDGFKWNIVEQKKFVECGIKYFQDENLKFYYDIKSCISIEKPSTILLSSVIEYIERPFLLLKSIIDEGFEYVIIDRTIFHDAPDRITVQRVPPDIYDASYPCWIFNRKKILDFFTAGYELVADFEALGGEFKIDGIKSRHEGYVFKKRTVRK
ncbi:MAG TPA: methyltransferase, TIGR04325 family [Candidatus Wallbacteria bacterium]|nr:methyltransferase, TIGR04325 family [Candidatus Wallbacteria bacterium]